MYRYWFAFGSIGLLLACGPVITPEQTTDRPEPTPNIADSLPEYDLTFVAGQRVGAITPTTDSLALQTAYGSDLVHDTLVYVGEGMTQAGALIFPGRPEELELIWLSDGRRRPEIVYIRRPDAPWTDRETGIHIGTTLEELQQLNGRPFVFSGFDWDYGGTVTDWRGGQLTGLNLRLQPSAEQYDQLPQSLSGDRPIRSDNFAARDLGIRVNEIYVVLNRPTE